MAQQRSIARAAHEALGDIRDAMRRWDGWNGDAAKAVNALANLLLQQHAAQQPAVWHPGLLFQFPDLPARYDAANLAAAKRARAQLGSLTDKMAHHVASIGAAADKLAALAPAAQESPFAYCTLETYAHLARAACGAYGRAMAVRREHLDELDATIRAFEDGAVDAPPPGALDSDAQLVRILAWQDSPGLRDARLDLPGRTSIVCLADFDDLLQLEAQAA